MQSGFTVASNEHLIRTQLWSKQLKQLLLDDLFAMKYVRILTEFPDGSVFNIPTLGEAETHNFVEGQRVKYDRMDTGNYQFSFDKYEYSAHSISEKFKRDSFYAADVLAAYPERQHRALMQNVEARILSRGPAGQTAGNLNTINGANHRWIAKGTSESLSIKDFFLARNALTKALVPMNSLVAIIDSSAAYSLQNQSNAINLLTPQPQWGSIVHTGISTGMNFAFNLAGFDVYVSNYLQNGLAETIDGVTSTVGVANIFFSAAPGDTLPIIGGFRQMPTVFHDFNKDTQEDEYATFQEYGFQLYREENMVTVISDTDVVA